MKLMTFLELGRYSHYELAELLQNLRRELPVLPVGSQARANALMNIRHVRMFLARRDHRMAMRPTL